MGRVRCLGGDGVREAGKTQLLGFMKTPLWGGGEDWAMTRAKY